MNAVEVRNLSFNYEGAFVFDNINFNVKKGSFLTVIGKGGSGKSTLFNIISGNLVYDGSISIFDMSINTALESGILGFVSLKYDDFTESMVMEELINVLKKRGKDFEIIKNDIEKISIKLNINPILNKKISSLSTKEKLLFKFTLQLLLRPKVLIIDNCFSFFDFEKNDIIRELKRVFKKSTVINITNDVNECLFGQEVLFLKDNLYKKNVFLLDSEDFLSNELDVPFIILLSEKLKFYGLIDKTYLDVERLIGDLWE